MQPTRDLIADATRTWELVECSHERLKIHYPPWGLIALRAVLGLTVMLVFLVSLFGDRCW